MKFPTVKESLMSRKVVLLVGLFFIGLVSLAAQDAQRAVNYMEALMGYQKHINHAQMMYFRCAVHCQDPQQVETYRKELEGQLSSAIKSVQLIPDFDGDATLKTEALTILQGQLKSCQQDYMEIGSKYAGARNTAEAIEEYYDLLEAAEKKHARQTERFERAYRVFAAKNSIQLMETEGESEVEYANRVNTYYRALNKPTLPVQSQLARAIAALEEQSARRMETARFSMAAEIKKAKYYVEQQEAFEDDDSLRQSTAEYLEVMDQVANVHFLAIVTYLERQNAETLTGYNDAVDFFNTQLNPAIEQLNVAQDNFLKNHVPEPPKGQKRI